MDKSIEELIASPEFGNGRASPQSYTTAWVARIYNRDKTGPEFPQSLDYIRRNQMRDGSWGVEKFSIFDRIVSTLSAIICLKQWNCKEDQEQIEKGVQFIKHNLIQLDELDKLKSQMSVGFELLLPALIDEANVNGFVFHHDEIIQKYRTERKVKLDKIEKCEKFCKWVSGFGAWYFNLEGLATKYKDNQIEEMIGRDGLICGCYSATAYALWRGIESRESFEQHSTSCCRKPRWCAQYYQISGV